MMRSLCFLLLSALLLLAVPAARAQSLYADPKARQAGDVLTVVLAEQTAAQRESGYDASSSAGLGGSASVEGPSLSSRFGTDAQFSKNASSSNQTVQSDLLEGRLTARVTETDEAGNLIVEGERRLNVNGVTHVMYVSGLVRPLDVRYDNTVLSYQIANAEVEYRKAGLGRRFLSPGFFAKAGGVVLLGAAIVFGLQ